MNAPFPWPLAAVLSLVVLWGGLLFSEPAAQPLADPDLAAMPAARSSDLPPGTNLGVVMELPLELRQPNWGGGSCVHASNVMVLRHQGLFEMADWWRKTYSGGEYDTRLAQRLDAAGLRYAYAHNDEKFLMWCIRTRRGAGIFYKPSHSICCVGMDDTYVYLLDNNDVNRPEREGHYERVPREEFFLKWRGYGGFAWTLVYSPLPPEPHLEP